MKRDIVFIWGDDWEGMYVDGKLVLEDHSLYYKHVLNALGIESSAKEANDAWLYHSGNLPSSLDDVVLVDEPFEVDED